MKATVDTFAGAAVAKEDMIRNKFGQYWVLSMLAGMYIGFGILHIIYGAVMYFKYDQNK